MFHFLQKSNGGSGVLMAPVAGAPPGNLVICPLAFMLGPMLTSILTRLIVYSRLAHHPFVTLRLSNSFMQSNQPITSRSVSVRRHDRCNSSVIRRKMPCGDVVDQTCKMKCNAGFAEDGCLLHEFVGVLASAHMQALPSCDRLLSMHKGLLEIGTHSWMLSGY